MPANSPSARRARVRVALAFVLAAAAALTLSGCAKPAPVSAPGATTGVAPAPSVTSATPSATSAIVPTATAPATTTPAPVPKTSVRVYIVRGEFLGVGSARRVAAAAPAKGAMLALLAGPTSAEKTWGLHTEIPSGTKLLGVKIAGGVATVNLSKRFESGGGTLTMTLRVAQVVDTLTQFTGVSKVAFRIGGKKVTSIGGEGIMVSPPVGRTNFTDSLPAIMLETPLPGAIVKSPIRLKGSANVFEGQFRARVTDAAGKVVADQPIKATSGTGTRGTFDASVAFKAAKHGKGWLTVFEPSAKDGSPMNVVKIRIYQ